jgi:nitrogen fixation/metabolism regulation signal transduction histidine kinase
MSEKISDKVWKIIDEFIENYRKGTEKYGSYWKIFYVSMIAFILIFVLFAVFLAIYYIP